MSVDSLESSLDTLRHWLTFWTLAVVLGLILEYRVILWQILLTGSKILLLRSTAFDQCAFKKLCLHALGAILVTLGVAGELWIEFRSSRVENTLRIESAKIIADLSLKTATARNKALELEKETLLLRAQLRTQQSRSALLMEASSQERFVKIEPFRKQKIQIAQCGRQDNEVTMTVITLMVLIRARGWSVDDNNPFEACTTGLQVMVRHNASESTLAAAKALGGVLNELGLIPGSQQFIQLPAPPEPPAIQGWNPPSPDTVLIVVQIHP